MTERGSAIVIGGGHNGLVCANYLARAGRRVTLLEANNSLGGACATHEFHPGFRVSSVAHFLYGLDRTVVRELELERLGLQYSQSDVSSVALHESEPAIVLGGDGDCGGPATDADRVAWRRFVEMRARYASVLATWHSAPPPRLAFDRWRDAWPVAKLAWAVRRLGQRDMRELLRVATMSIDDWLDECFSSPRLRGALALDAVLGTRAGPRSGGTVFASLHRAAGGGRLAVVRGGLGALTTALATAAQSAGVTLRTGTPVTGIEMADSAVAGVRLASGELLESSLVVAAVDPKMTLLKLLGARHLEAQFARRVHHVRAIGTAAKLHLALAGMPTFQGVAQQDLGARLLLAPSTDYVERAFNPAKYQQSSPHPVMEIHVPTIHDPTLAPSGRHVLSAIVQYAPSNIDGGWGAHRAAFLETCLLTLEKFAPGIRTQVLHAELLTPADIEQRTGASGGHWHHGELALDQYLMLRPVPGAAQYRAPVAGLYLASAGTHPGGGVLGTAGRLAAAAVLVDTAQDSKGAP